MIDLISIKGFLILLLVLLVILGIGNVFTTVLQDFFIFRPWELDKSYPFAFKENHQELNFNTPNNGSINALWFRSSEEQGSKGVIFYCHGNKGDLRRWAKHNRFFRTYGYDFFVFDYRGFGKSRGPKTEKNLHGDTEYLYDFLNKHYKEEKIIVFGRSIGCAPAASVAAKKYPGSLVLETPFHSIRDLFYCYYPFLPRWFSFKYQLDNAKALKNVACPVHILQGTDDRIVPYKSSVKLKPLLKAGDTFTVIEGGKHGDLYNFASYLAQMDVILNKK